MTCEHSYDDRPDLKVLWGPCGPIIKHLFDEYWAMNHASVRAILSVYNIRGARLAPHARTDEGLIEVWLDCGNSMGFLEGLCEEGPAKKICELVDHIVEEFNFSEGETNGQS